MIVWLASYPRSGNTLLRTILHQQFGLATFSDEQGESEVLNLSAVTMAGLGISEISCDWSEYYEQAQRADELTLIKTHRPPVDRNKAIYVVRDGRSAHVSYASYHASFVKDKPKSLLALVLGLDFYGGWSEHYRQWMRIQCTPLVLRYEDLVEPTQATIKEIADFLGVACPDRDWKNPFLELRKESPEFFRAGQCHWKGSSDWSDLTDSIFFSIHGELMVELGYATNEERSMAIERLAPEVKELLSIDKGLANELSVYRKICLERQAVIDELKSVCDERLALIDRLSGKPA